MTTATKRKRLLRLADYIEGQPEEEFDQSSFFHPCGTPACIAGHCSAMIGYELASINTLTIVRDKCIGYVEVVAAEFLGITKEEAEILFAGGAPWQTQKAAVAELRRMARELAS